MLIDSGSLETRLTATTINLVDLSQRGGVSKADAWTYFARCLTNQTWINKIS